MRSLFKSLRVGISMTSATVLCANHGRQATTDVLAVRTFGAVTPAAVGAELGAALDEANVGRFPTTIVLADEWTRIFMVTPPRNIERMRDCHAAVALRFQSLYGDLPGEWCIQAAHDAVRPFLACALPQSLRDVLLATCAERRLKVVSVAPHFVGAWNHSHRHLSNDAWFGTVYAGTLTLGAISGRRLMAIRRTAVPLGALQERTWLNDQVSREALRLGLPAPHCLSIYGETPDAWLIEGGGAGIDCKRLGIEPSDALLGQIPIGAAFACSEI